MKALALAALLALTLLAASRAPDGPASDAMNGLKDNLKALAAALPDPESDAASLAALAEMQRHALAAKALSPDNLDDVPADRRAAHQAAYRADLARLLQHLLEMEIDLLEGRRDEAIAAIRGELLPLRDAAHERYQK